MSEGRHANPYGIIWAAAAVSALLGILATLLGVGYVRQKNLQKSAREESARAGQAAAQARDAANRGNRARDEAEALVEFLLDDLSVELESIGRSDLLLAAAQKAVDYFENLPPSLSTPESQSKHAFVLTALAQGHYVQGNHSAATNAMRRCIDLRRNLAAQVDPAGDHAYDLGREISELALFHNADGDHEGALELYREALQIFETPPPGAIFDGHWDYGRATAHFGRGEVERRRGRYAEALQAYAEAGTHLEAALAKQPEKVGWLKKRMNLRNNSGVAWMYEGDFEKAEKQYLLGLETARMLVKLEPQNRRWEKELATTLMNLGTCLDEQEQFQSAEPLIREALTLRQGLAAWDSKNARTMRDLAHVWRNLASLQFSSGQPESALVSCRESLKAYRRLLTLDPGRERWINDMSRSAQRFQDRLVEAGLEADALALLRETAAFAEANRAAEPGADVWDELLAGLYAEEGELSEVEGSGVNLKAWLNALQHRTALLDAQPRRQETLFQWAAACLRLGQAYRHAGLASSAIVCFALSQKVFRDMLPEGAPQRELHLDWVDREQTLAHRILQPEMTPPILVASGADWLYWDQRAWPGPNWMNPAFKDASWPGGPAPLGYGEPDLNTRLNFGDEAGNKPLTAWFRHRFTMPRLPQGARLKFSLRRDDGAVVYLNGQELFRDGLPEGPIGPAAVSAMTQGLEERVYHNTVLDASRVPGITGTNVLAVEIHQNEPQSSDLAFDLELTVVTPDAPGAAPVTLAQAVEVLREALPVVLRQQLGHDGSPP